MSNIKYKPSFTEEDLSKLRSVLSSSRPNSKLALRARVLLALSDSVNSNIKLEDIAAQCNTTITTVHTIRAKFSTEGLDAALYRQQRDFPPTIPVTYGIEEQVIKLALSAPPEGHKHWTETLLANHCVSLGYCDKISQPTIHRFLKKHNISLK